MRTRLIFDKLGQYEFDRLVDHIAPEHLTKVDQTELIDILKNLFREKISITHRRMELLNYQYDKSIPISEHIGRINQHASDFGRTNLFDDNLRVLFLLQSFCYHAITTS